MSGEDGFALVGTERFSSAGIGRARRPSDGRTAANARTTDDRRAKTPAAQTSGSLGPRLPYFGCLLERQRFDRRERVVRGQIRMQRRDRHVPVAHGLVVRPIVRLPVVLPFLDPVVRAPLRDRAARRPT